MKALFSRLLLPVLVLVVTLCSSGAMAAADSQADTCPSPTDSQSQVINAVGSTTSTTTNNCSDSAVTKVIRTVVQLLSLIAGGVAVIMIVLAGFKYITSGGEASKVSNAKNTLLYALVGIAVAALAQFLVHFVLYQSSKV